MIEQVLSRHNAALRVEITVKTLISLGIIALAVILPQLVHLASSRRSQAGSRSL